METRTLRAIVLSSLFTTAAACSSMVEHREGQTQIPPPQNPKAEVYVQELQHESPVVQFEAQSFRAQRGLGNSTGRHSRSAKMKLGSPDVHARRLKPAAHLGAQPAHTPTSLSREAYQHYQESDFADPRESPFSTFSTDVDTASYANMRRFLESGSLPIADSIRIEEFLNYFEYEPMATQGEHPVGVATSWAPCPWNPDNLLLQVRVETQATPVTDLPPLNLVYLIDTSGSMHSQLALLVNGLSMLTQNLREVDTVSIVTYAGTSGIALQPTNGLHRQTILNALNNLRSGGSTAGSEGIKTAYALARRNFQVGSVNRVILATDGDFNVGVSDQGSLVRLIEKERESGVFLSVLGFGRGNYQDHRLESIADHGNGQYSYIDGPLEAHRVLVKRAGGTLNTVAKDVKLRLEFNPEHIGEYRLIGYDNRRLTSKEFADDKRDAGDIGAGHMVTALYEITPRAKLSTQSQTPSRYQTSRASVNAHSEEWLTTEVRYKLPQGLQSTLLTHRTGKPAIETPLTRDWSLLASLAEFGLLLKDSKFKGKASYQRVLKLAQAGAYGSHDPARQEYVGLVARAAQLAELD